MERLEKSLAFLALGLMVVFTALVAYAGIALDIVLPTCDQHLTPYKTAGVFPKEDRHFEVHYVARMWAFEPAELILPENADVDLYVSAVDVNHGFDVIGTNVNLMAVPGTVNAAHHVFHKIGEYLVVCHEYCGLNHQNMLGKIRVVAPQEYTRLMQELATRITSEGEKLSADKNCASCHSTDGTEGLAPTFKGLFGKREQLIDGSEVQVDEAYLIDSIKNPDHRIVKNYAKGSMPAVELTDDELDEMVAYIKSLK